MARKTYWVSTSILIEADGDDEAEDIVLAWIKPGSKLCPPEVKDVNVFDCEENFEDEDSDEEE